MPWLNQTLFRCKREDGKKKIFSEEKVFLFFSRLLALQKNYNIHTTVNNIICVGRYIQIIVQIYAISGVRTYIQFMILNILEFNGA